MTRAAVGSRDAATRRPSDRPDNPGDAPLAAEQLVQGSPGLLIEIPHPRGVTGADSVAAR
jgi:hypothetical protein